MPSLIQTNRGFSMIELLVAVLVMGIGVLGVSALQLVSLQNNRSALVQSEAVQYAYDVTYPFAVPQAPTGVITTAVVRSNLVAILGRTAAYTGREITWAQLMKMDEPIRADLSGLVT